MVNPIGLFKQAESDLQKKGREYGKKRGWRGYKFKSEQNAGVPDYLFMKKGKPTIFFEYKAEGGSLSALQRKVHNEMRAAGAQIFNIEYIEDVHEAFALFD